MLSKLLETGLQEHTEDALELLYHLEKLPLAIAQAAAFIRQTREPISRYLEMFKECEINQQELLDESLTLAEQPTYHHIRAR